MFFRGVFYWGRRYRCPCCGWSLRAFADKWSLIGTTTDGYCPRCNAKARHRRLWLYLTEKTDLFSTPTRLLEVAPWWSLFHNFKRKPNLSFVGLDILRSGEQVNLVGDATAMPLSADSVDAALCIHTLEHIDDDRSAIAELYRVLQPGGWAIVSVPIRLDAETYEDPSITSPEERLQAFGERGHVRWYGADFPARLQAVGFEVQMDPADNVSEETKERFGLRDDENLFHCIKPTLA